MRGELRPFLEETYAPSSLSACPWLDVGETARLWQNFIGQRDPRAWSRVWTVAMLIAFANRRSVA